MQLRMIAHVDEGGRDMTLAVARWFTPLVGSAAGRRRDACVTWQPYPGVVSPQFRIGSDACAMWQAIRLRRGLSTRESPQCENGGHGGPLFFFVVLLRPSKLSHVVLFQYPIRDKILKPVTCLKLSGLSGKVKRERIMTSEWRLSWFCGFNCTLRFAGTQKISPANARSDS